MQVSLLTTLMHAVHQKCMRVAHRSKQFMSCTQQRCNAQLMHRCALQLLRACQCTALESGTLTRGQNVEMLELLASLGNEPGLLPSEAAVRAVSLSCAWRLIWICCFCAVLDGASFPYGKVGDASPVKGLCLTQTSHQSAVKRIHKN